MILVFLGFLAQEAMCWSNGEISFSATIFWAISKKWLIIKQDNKFYIACKLRFMFFHYKWEKLNTYYNSYETPEKAQEALEDYLKNQLEQKAWKKSQKIKDKITEVKTKPKK